MSLFPHPVPEDPEINGLTCPGYYERKLAEVDAKLAAERAGYDATYRKMLRVRMWTQLFFAALSLVVLVLVGGWGALARLAG
jgi:hypothetical protein